MRWSKMMSSDEEAELVAIVLATSLAGIQEKRKAQRKTPSQGRCTGRCLMVSSSSSTENTTAGSLMMEAICTESSPSSRALIG
ncbi:hypothetical protein HPB52_000078 [Rhipicephalus sanguineus]|uniref:Uncharacterized protein n=1 Tax=Rhipicephalus sanguineus TaxID=34632 RepID=A0A9D4PU63_RHISA|nr:hypothetical protein HPB52_000078 [Rhipicephalus sanguineus]